MTRKTVKTLRAFKNLLKKTLPEKIHKDLQSYEKFADQEEPDDAKSFSAYHLALKSAISHMETLLKLEKWTVDTTETSKSEGSFDLFQILEESQKLKDKEEDDDEN